MAAVRRACGLLAAVQIGAAWVTALPRSEVSWAVPALLLAPFAACATSSPASSQGGAVPPPGAAGNALGAGTAGDGRDFAAQGSAAVADALRAAPGTRMQVKGHFAAMSGPCRAAPPTRSAWHLIGDDGPPPSCIYVDGRLPGPLNALTGKGTGTAVVVSAAVAGEGNDRYLVADKVEIVNPGGP